MEKEKNNKEEKYHLKYIKSGEKESIGCAALIFIVTAFLVIALSDPNSWEAYQYSGWIMPILFIAIPSFFAILFGGTTIKKLGICPHCDEEINITTTPIKNINEKKWKFSCPNCEKDVYILKNDKLNVSVLSKNND